MRRRIFTILGLLALVTSVQAKYSTIELRAGFSPAPRFDVTPSKKAKPSFEVGAEYRYLLTDNTEIGGGIAYQRHGRLKGFTDIEGQSLRVRVKGTSLYDSVPVYATVRYSFRNTTEVTPYIRAAFGYSFNVGGSGGTDYETYSNATGTVVDRGRLKSLKASNGIYYSAGAGLTYRNLMAELSYQVNTARMDGVRYDGQRDGGRADNRRLTLSLGYRFSF